MKEKFSEEEYQTIVNVADNTVKGNLFSSASIIKFWGELVHSSLGGEYSFQESCSEIMAIINPLTREWAHDQFVEKEKTYYWTSKKYFNKCRSHLYKAIGGVVLSAIDYGDTQATPLTESEIREWGYNPESFMREEVWNRGVE